MVRDRVRPKVSGPAVVRDRVRVITVFAQTRSSTTVRLHAIIGDHGVCPLCRVTVSVVWLLRSNLNTIQRVIVYQDVCSARPYVARHAEERDRAGVGRLAWGVATPLTQHTTLTRDRDRRHDTRCTRTSNEHRTLEPLVSAQDKSHPITSAQGSNPKIAPMLDLVALVSTRRRP